jgi:N-acetylmuramoyl-L-alanine amidase
VYRIVRPSVLAAGVGCVLLVASGALSLLPAASQHPTRPGAIAQATAPASPPAAAKTPEPVKQAVRLGPVEYVDAADFGARFGLKFVWLEEGKRFQLKGRSLAFECEVDSRDSMIDGARVFLGQPVRAVKGKPQLSRIDAERQLAPILAPGVGEARVPALKTIVLDPGHGGTDNGTGNTRLGLREKELTLDVALRLKKLLAADGWRVVLTRDTDIELPLPLRAPVANRAQADLFLSIHFNAVDGDTKVRGTEILTFAPRTQPSDESWSTRVNDAEMDAAPVNRYDYWSAVLAHALQRKLLGSLHTEDRGKKIRHLGVLRLLDCPGVLVEPVFLTNEAEAKKAATPAFRQQIAEALAEGVRAYGLVLESVRKKAQADLPH